MNFQPVLRPTQLGFVTMVPNTHESVTSIRQEAAERQGNVVCVHKLENEATVSDAKLESGCRWRLKGRGRVPLNTEADHELVAAGTMEAEDPVEPVADDGRGGCDGGDDGFREESDGESSEPVSVWVVTRGNGDVIAVHGGFRGLCEMGFWWKIWEREKIKKDKIEEKTVSTLSSGLREN
ncbi:hypothetical protein V6N11_056240 [Hibiscus sabdariffa]|uniref:Uncharacterized protein n=1 Tax=Hibiscus sabdariffa TaxID=183260 RepID=A0ABR2T3S0_9ROSI